MTRQLTESQLLEYIEDQLDSADAERVREALAKQPALLASLDRMKRDRDVLMSIDEPHVDVDLLGRIESTLARPMLIESRPGEFRRSRRRVGFRMRHYAAAAGLILAACVGAWMLNSGGSGPAAPDAPMDVAMNRGNGLESTPPRVVEERFDTTSAKTMVANATDAVLPTVIDVAEDVSDVADVQTASFALVMMAPDEEFATTMLASAVDELGSLGAVVQNVSEHDLEHFIAYEQMRAAAERQHDRRMPMMADQAGGRGSRAIEIPQQRIELPRRPVPQQLELEPLHLAGPQELAAQMPYQIEFSSMGAQYTVAVRASELNRLASRLQLHDQCPSTALCPLSSEALDSYRSCAPPIQLAHLRSVREANAELEALASRGKDVVVQLPVMYVQCDDCGLGRGSW